MPLNFPRTCNNTNLHAIVSKTKKIHLAWDGEFQYYDFCSYVFLSSDEKVQVSSLIFKKIYLGSTLQICVFDFHE